MPTLLRNTSPFLAVLLAACSGGGPAEEGGGAPSFDLSVTPGTVAVVLGGIAQVELRIETRDGFADAVALAVEGLPAGVGLVLPETSDAGQRTLALAVSAAVDAVAGDFAVTVRGVAGVIERTAVLTVQVRDTAFDFAIDAAPRAVVVETGASVVTEVAVSTLRGTLPDVTWSAEGLPSGVTARFEPSDGDGRRLILDAGATATAGTVEVVVVAAAGALRRETALLAHVLPPAVADGIRLTIPPVLQLRRGDMTSTEVAIERDRGITGDVELSLAGLPAGVGGIFDDSPARGAVSELQLTASAAAPVGEHLVTVTASRGAATARRHALLRVIDAAAAVDFRVQRVELGQAFFAPDPVLVGGKPAELRVHLLADEPGHPAPRVDVDAVAGGVLLGTRELGGPAFAPNRESPANLAESFRTTLPAEWIGDGLELTIRLDTGAAADREPRNDVHVMRPRIGTEIRIELVVVPIRLDGREPALGSYRDMLLAHWPLTDVTIRQRPVYVATSVTGVAANGDGWEPLLQELRLLQFLENGAGAFYYGVVPVSYGSGVAGIGYVGLGTSLGWDRTTGVLLHELGHNFGLRHAPCGGAGGPDADFPFTGGVIGTRGYDRRSGRLVDPRITRDLMGYCSPEWVSGYNHELVRARLGGPALSRQGGDDQPIPLLGIHGTVGVDGVATIGSVARAIRAWPGEERGDLQLRLVLGGGRVATFAARSVEIGCGGTPGERSFFAVLPDPGELEAIEVLRAGRVIGSRSAPSEPVAMARVAEAVRWWEQDGALELRWDATRWPELSVVHIGARRTALGVGLSGGAATLDVVDLAPGGEFEFAWGDGFDGGIERVTR